MRRYVYRDPPWMFSHLWVLGSACSPPSAQAGGVPLIEGAWTLYAHQPPVMRRRQWKSYDVDAISNVLVHHKSDKTLRLNISPALFRGTLQRWRC